MAAKNFTCQITPNEILEATVEAFGIQAKVETRSGMGNDLGFYADDKREVDQIVRNYIDITSSHLLKLKSHLNTLVTINRLPSEILTHIVSFAGLPRDEAVHPYILYTWVCRHWRSTLIQDSNLWRVIHFESERGNMNPFIRDFIQRSKLAPLDIVLTQLSDCLMSKFEDLFVSTSNRIHRVWFSDYHIAPLISGQIFPSLRAVQYIGGHHGLIALLSAIVDSKHLDTLHCTVETKVLSVDARDQLASILGRIRNLDVEIVGDYPEAMPITMDLLRNNAILENLRLTADTDDSHLTNSNDLIIFPKLQFLEIRESSLIKHIRTPKLSSLVMDCDLATELMPEVFDFSSIKCLYIIDSHSSGKQLDYGFIVGLKESVDSQSLFLTKFGDILRHFEDSVNSCFAVEDFLSDPKFPRDCFRLNLDSEKDLIPPLLSILPRMTSLTDLYLLVRHDKTYFTKIVTLVPSVQKLVLTYHYNLEDYFSTLRDTTLCPHLKHLIFVAHRPQHPERSFSDSVVKLLTEYLRSRHGIPDNKLECVFLEMSPPPPDNWLKELQKLVVTVVIE